MGNCTRFVAETLSWIPSGLGNANQWFANAQAKGLPTGQTPIPGSVAVWNTGEFGHVAEVIGTIPGGFRVKEENVIGNGIVDVRDVTGSALNGLQGFIYAPGISLPNLPSLPSINLPSVNVPGLQQLGDFIHQIQVDAFRFGFIVIGVAMIGTGIFVMLQSSKTVQTQEVNAAKAL